MQYDFLINTKFRFVSLQGRSDKKMWTMFKNNTKSKSSHNEFTSKTKPQNFSNNWIKFNNQKIGGDSVAGKFNQFKQKSKYNTHMSRTNMAFHCLMWLERSIFVLLMRDHAVSMHRCIYGSVLFGFCLPLLFQNFSAHKFRITINSNVNGIDGGCFKRNTPLARFQWVSWSFLMFKLPLYSYAGIQFIKLW